jgi:hypothetical protein
MKDLRILIISLVGLAIAAAFAALNSPPPPAPPLSVRSAGQDGSMALSQWLDESGYHSRQVLSSPIRLESEDALFILNPLLAYTSDEATRIQQWVRDGHLLVVAGSPYAVNSLLEPYDITLEFLDTMSGEVLSPANPLLAAPPFETVQAEARYRIGGKRTDTVTHLAAGTDPVLISFREGAGQVWVSGALRPFTNLGLHDAGSARLMLNLLAGLPPGTVVGFDEAKHGFSETPSSVMNWLVSVPAGWGILLALALTLVYLGLQGRRFGRALPLPDDRLRREPVEYIQAMANLFRRSGLRSDTLGHYRAQLRRRLTERYAVDPKLNDAELVKTVIYHEPSLDEAELRRVLKALSNPRPSEADLVSAALDVDTWLRRLH